MLGFYYYDLSDKRFNVLEEEGCFTSERVTIYTIKSTDEGVAFLIISRGLTIFFAGDHALWSEQDSALYYKGISKIEKLNIKIDIAFLPIAKGLTASSTKNIEKGFIDCVRLLRPRYTFPMHIRYPEKIINYEKFITKMEELNLPTLFLYPKKNGDSFFIE